MSTNETIHALAEKIRQFDFDGVESDSTYCKIAPGLATILDGVQQIAINFAPPSVQIGLKLAFSVLETAIKSPCKS